MSSISTLPSSTSSLAPCLVWSPFAEPHDVVLLYDYTMTYLTDPDATPSSESAVTT
jgi:hypothetical protein